jgi:hypothetical protein
MRGERWLAVFSVSEGLQWLAAGGRFCDRSIVTLNLGLAEECQEGRTCMSSRRLGYGVKTSALLHPT